MDKIFVTKKVLQARFFCEKTAPQAKIGLFTSKNIEVRVLRRTVALS